MKKQHARLAPLSVVLVLGIVLAACSAGSVPAPSDTSAPTEPSTPTTEPSIPTEPSAPADPLSSTLVGKWEGIDVELGALIIEFKSDGVYEITDSSGTFPATYEMVDDDTFILIDPSSLSEATVDFVRSGDTLTMTMTMDGSTLELQRMP